MTGWATRACRCLGKLPRPAGRSEVCSPWQKTPSSTGSGMLNQRGHPTSLPHPELLEAPSSWGQGKGWGQDGSPICSNQALTLSQEAQHRDSPSWWPPQLTVYVVLAQAGSWFGTCGTSHTGTVWSYRPEPAQHNPEHSWLRPQIPSEPLRVSLPLLVLAPALPL